MSQYVARVTAAPRSKKNTVVGAKPDVVKQNGILSPFATPTSLYTCNVIRLQKGTYCMMQLMCYAEAGTSK